ncbi:hypothetical protein N748_17090 [Legionella pneumophila str. 121004]|nr:hypothetical protein N748_17090 [Legionella pneumophila str. 121004]ERH42056.1 hypothetical protein N750_15215 [Legionella pneumophila str. Leg01/53]ERH46591.1 hypothetical protein N751_07100 [Legionella pneumophila str. Leg01/11]ERI48682.1 hypothetical protein N749_08965 [Legionella pneumophila str. Leg01/20]
MFINNRLTLYPDKHSKAIHLKFDKVIAKEKQFYL